jgi:hypothetical protein
MSKKIRCLYAFGMAMLCMGVLARAGADQGRMSIGINLMAGGRYDDLRMCVGSPAGVKGGPIADIMLTARYGLSQRWTAGIDLPLFRPILFGAAFDMVQFEPQFTLDYRKPVSGKVDIVAGPGLGLSLHYGPDYTTAKNAENPESFWAAGPFLSGRIGLGFGDGARRGVGIQGFYTPLFSDSRPAGTVLGAALVGQFDLYSPIR